MVVDGLAAGTAAGVAAGVCYSQLVLLTLLVSEAPQPNAAAATVAAGGQRSLAWHRLLTLWMCEAQHVESPSRLLALAQERLSTLPMCEAQWVLPTLWVSEARYVLPTLRMSEVLGGACMGGCCGGCCGGRCAYELKYGRVTAAASVNEAASYGICC